MADATTGLRKLKIDQLSLDLGLSAREYAQVFLDLETGAVEWLEDFSVTGIESDLGERIEEEPGRYAQLPKQDTRVEWGRMSAFAATIDDDEVREKLRERLQGRGAFRRFRDYLSRDQALQNEWDRFEFEDSWDDILLWLRGHGVEPEWVNPLPRPVSHVEAVVVPQKAEPKAKRKVVSLLEWMALGARDQGVEGFVTFRMRHPDPRYAFKTLARQLCNSSGHAWRTSYIKGSDMFRVEGATLTLDREGVRLVVEVSPEAVEQFGEGGD